MKIDHKKISDKIHLLTFRTQRDVTSTLLRFQEYYESPNFKGKIFLLKEYKEWYILNSPNSKKTGKFTYYSDWNGFNIPSYVLKPFYKGRFDPLSKSEKMILKIFEDTANPFYIIGIHEETKIGHLLKHEIAHGLFYTNKKYRDEVLQILKKYNTEKIKEELRSKAGYHEEVLEDEIHAYAIDSIKSLKTPIPKKLSIELRKIFNQLLQ
ncbi:MAG: ABC transporter ATP-binding protein [Candidatus Buchananbacteria bacterium]